MQRTRTRAKARHTFPFASGGFRTDLGQNGRISRDAGGAAMASSGIGRAVGDEGGACPPS
ncbi:hypothetical protein FRAHR75_270030 [Frankia sp. Hr75.2]|nr:hypothetical protein FRAHR75_270030 [Frankia sp. Hr75.2]